MSNNQELTFTIKLIENYINKIGINIKDYFIVY